MNTLSEGRQEFAAAKKQGRRDVTPGSRAFIFTGNSDPVLKEAVWGFTSRDRRLVINARAETAPDKTMFYTPFRTGRCLIPARGFYEWDRERQKVSFEKPQGGVLYLAGLLRQENDGERFVILTTVANASVTDIHDRMPLILTAAQTGAWLGGDGAQALLSWKPGNLSVIRDFEQLSLF